MSTEKNKCELSLCLPIYNRLDCFKYTFDRLLIQLKELSSPEVEVIVSINPAEEILEQTIEYLTEKRKEQDFILNVNETNIGGSNNIIKAVSLAQGRLVWVIGDDDVILPGCVRRVLNILRKYPDVGWIYLANARLSGFPNDEKSVVGEVNNYQLKSGYYKNGKETVIKVHNKIGGNLLFSSSNIFLRSVYVDITQKIKDVVPQLGSTFAAAAKGAVYLDNEIGVLAGGCISWKHEADYNNTIRYFKDMMSVVGHGFTKGEIEEMIRYHMRHEALALWFQIYKLCLTGNKYGRHAFLFFYKIMPIQTIITLTLSPLLAVYLCFRHQYRNLRRRKSCIDYLKSKNPDELVVSKIRS